VKRKRQLIKSLKLENKHLKKQNKELISELFKYESRVDTATQKPH
jgi:predicted RNase H-like nuclease (RuvC/YqgF family)